MLVLGSPGCEWLYILLQYSLLIMHVLCSPESEWLCCLTAILTCWSSLSLALQRVSSCGALLQFQPADHACSQLFSGWVAMVPCCNSSLLIMSVLGLTVGEWLLYLATIFACWSCLSLAHQKVSRCGALLQFHPSHYICLFPDCTQPKPISLYVCSPLQVLWHVHVWFYSL